MDISKKIDQKLDFDSRVHQKINQLLSVVDTFKGSWKVLEQSKSSYLKELRKIPRWRELSARALHYYN